jgi:hypothetical protein
MVFKGWFSKDGFQRMVFKGWFSKNGSFNYGFQVKVFKKFKEKGFLA